MKNIPLLIGTILGTILLIVAVAFFSSGNNSNNLQDQVVDRNLIESNARHLFTSSADNSGENLLNQQNQTDKQNSQGVQNDKVATNSALAKNQNNQNQNEQNQDDQNKQVTLQQITIVEFSDFQCPACKATLPLLESVKAKYPGQIQLIFKHFPLSELHPNAGLAAIASEAVANIDESAFWSFHDLLFEHQSEWSKIKNQSELKDTFATYATQLGIDRIKFLEKMEDNSISNLVAGDVALGNQLKVNSTPTFYVNGVKSSAPQLLKTVESVVTK